MSADRVVSFSGSNGAVILTLLLSASYLIVIPLRRSMIRPKICSELNAERIKPTFSLVMQFGGPFARPFTLVAAPITLLFVNVRLSWDTRNQSQKRTRVLLGMKFVVQQAQPIIRLKAVWFRSNADYVYVAGYALPNLRDASSKLFK